MQELTKEMSYHCLELKLLSERDINVRTQKTIVTSIAIVASPVSKGGMVGNLKRKLQDILGLAVRKKTRVMKHVVMQAIGHYRAPCDWPKKQWRDDKFSSHEVARENHWT